MCDWMTAALGIASAGSDAIAIGNKVEEKQREKETKKSVTGIETATENEITKQASQFGDNGDVLVTNKKQTTSTQPQKRKQLISLRLNDTTKQKTIPQDDNLGLNI